MTFIQQLETLQDKNNSLVCVGLDSDLDKLPERFKQMHKPQFEFNKWVIDQTYEYVCAYKPNSAFYEERGAEGIQELKDTCDYINKQYPMIPIILDAKRADIGNTNNGYAVFAFDYLGADALTVNPYLGKVALEPFLVLADKGIIVLCKTSNDGSAEFQNLICRHPEGDTTEGSITMDSSSSHQNDEIEMLYQNVAQKVVSNWNTNNNCLLVVGATYPQELERVRAIAPSMTFLVPGVGAQGADVEKTLQAGLRADKKGLIIAASRSILFSDNPQEAAKLLKDQINEFRR